MQTILLLHGAIGSKAQLQPLADVLSDQYSVHTFNFSGHGGEPFSAEDFSIPFFADEVLSYLEKNKIGAVNIFGYSMGGYIALYLAKHHPHLVKKIITLATKFYWDEAVAAKEAKMLDGASILLKVPAFAKQLEERHAPNDWKMVLDKTKKMLLQLGSQNVLELEDYNIISTECLLLLGDMDKMVTVEETKDISNDLQNAKYQLLENTSHPIEQVDTAMLSHLIRQFFG